MADPRTLKREITALSEAMTELNLETGTIVTRQEKADIKVPRGTIKVIPIWRFLLDLIECE